MPRRCSSTPARILASAIGMALIAPLTTAPTAQAAVGSYVSKHVLYINGDGADDTVDVTCVAGNVKVNGANPDDGSATCASLTWTEVTTYGGADAVDLSAVTSSDFPKMTEPAVYAGPDADTITGSPIGIYAAGGDGNDTLTGLGGPDRLSGNVGDDDVDGGGGKDLVFENRSGAMTLSDSQLVIGTETDTLTSIERAILNVGGPTYDGSAFAGPQRITAGGAVTVVTGPDDDTLAFAGGSSGSFDGGGGTDTLEVQAFTDVELDPTQVTTGGGTYTLASIEKGYVYWQTIAPSGGTVDARDWVKPLRYVNFSPRRVTFLGGHARDRATGGVHRDILKGFDGDDALRGGPGKDSLIGGRGYDVCKGGPGADSLRACEA